MSEGAIIRAYMLDVWRGLLLTALIVTGIVVAGLFITGKRDLAEPVSIPLLLAAFVAWDFVMFRRARR